MMVQLELGRWEIVGIVGANRGCGRSNSPGIYTRVSAFSDWIRNRIRAQNITLPSQKSTENNLCTRDPIYTNLDSGCGTTIELPPISGGSEAETGQWPWIASLQLTKDKDHYCGGVLITDRHILTGTSCVKEYVTRINKILQK